MSEDTGTWALLIDGNMKYLALLPGSKSEILKVWRDAQVLECTLAFEYFNNISMRQAPDGNAEVRRQQLTLPFDACLEESPCYIKPTAIKFFEDMKESDRAGYKSCVDQARTYASRLRMQRSNITLASHMPEGISLPGGVKLQ